MGDLQTRITRALRESSRAADGRIDDARAEDALTCPLGCEGLVFSHPDLRWDHIQTTHPGCLSESWEGPGTLEARGNLKARTQIRSLDVRNEGNTETELRSPGPRRLSAESMNVEAISRSQTPTRPTTENLAQLSIKQGQPAIPPNPPSRNLRLSPTVSSSSRKRAASADIQSAPLTSRQSPQSQSFQAQRRDVSSGDVKLGVPGSFNVESSRVDSSKLDSEFSRDIPFSLGSEMQSPQGTSSRRLYDPSSPARSSHARNTSAPTKVIRTTHHQHASKPERAKVHEKQGIRPKSADVSMVGEAAIDESSQLASASAKTGKSNTKESPQGRSLPHHPRGVFQIPAQAKYPDLIMQPDSRPISHDQLAAEVKGIYAGLVMVEGKCISVDGMQMSPDQRFTSEHWQALVALHRTLLHEHHDFLLASQHPSANSALRKLAAKYSMPGRMWKHGIHSFLELMRRYLPESREYMIAFILLAYQMMALLYETVPAFEQTWIECLGDLGRYRMAVEDDDFRDRETWGGVARSWYSKAADQSPEIGRLYHHLAILAGPNALQKLFYYVKALTCEQPFPSARDSILTLFDPLLGTSPPAFARSHPGEANFIKLHAMQFGRSPMDGYEPMATEYLENLDGHIGRVTAKWNEAGVYTAVANIGGILEYGSDTELLHAYQELARLESNANSSGSADKPDSSTSQVQETGAVKSQAEENTDSTEKASESKGNHQSFERACRLALDTLNVVLNRIGDKNILPHVHVFLVFIWGIFALPPRATQYVLERFPWDQLAFFLNTLASSEDVDCRFQTLSDYMQPNSRERRPLPEDFLIRGQVWCRGFFPDEWFDDGGDVEERMLERASTSKARAERILWIGTRIGSHGRWLHYNASTKHFSAIRSATQDASTAEIENTLGNAAIAKQTPSEEDSREMDFVKQSEGLASPQPSTNISHGMLMSVPKIDMPAAAQLVVRDFTVLVLDTSMLLNQLPFFTSTAQGGGFDIVIPDEVVVRLKFLDGVSHPDDTRARAALEAIKISIDEGRRVMIKNAEGVNVTDEAFVSCVHQRHATHLYDLEEITIGLARRETDRDLEKSRVPSEEARPAILITDDRKMRVKANGFRVAAIASSFLSKVITGARRRSISRGPGSS
ncbi:hypothetical protein EV356DRAFT_537688 [Viridothelium virens]|uniref:Nonsense-mediated mRNA decay factor n=1 Tax=Viridothelium virens TaxID=1048519 RepID=A0A6A6GT06_VIRVR|nr:hypothetical protein EV356DRAFT_537688 [Viridothelium virens]